MATQNMRIQTLIRPSMQRPPRNITSPRPNTYVFDMGQNFAGWVRLTIPEGAGRRGLRIRLRHAEVLSADGTLNRANLQTAKSEDYYVMRGDIVGPEVYEPRFTFHGFRYVELFNFRECRRWTRSEGRSCGRLPLAALPGLPRRC